MAEFKDLKTDAGLAQLNTHLATRSYISGFTPSQQDVTVLSQISATVNCTKFPHAARWLKHVLSFCANVRANWPGQASAGAAPSKGEEKKAAASAEEDDDDDDFSMKFDDDDEDGDADAAAQAIIARKQKERDDKKKTEASNRDTSKMAKSTLILDVKPEDSETDLSVLEKAVRAITQEGLLWGACERKPVAFGVEKLRIMAVIVDDLVGVDDLQETIEAIEGVQSTDVYSFNKI